MNEALLLTGVFGTGKSTIAADLAELLESSPIRHAAIDLDWLTWTNAVTTRADEHHMMLANLRLIVDNYRRHGVQRFILARAIVDAAELDSLRTAIGMPLRVVELTVTLDEIERRLAQDPTETRRDDLAQTRAWLDAGALTGIADITIINDRRVREVSVAIAEWMRWRPSAHAP